MHNVLKKLYKDKSKKNLLLPGHNYLGPGNDLDNGRPVNRADQIAELHDFQYEYAASERNVRDSDFNAIKSFAEDAFKNKSIYSAIGLGGISAKYAVESAVGVIYPQMSDRNKSFYNERQKFINLEYHEWLKTHRRGSFEEFKQTNAYRTASEYYQVGGAGYNQYYSKKKANAPSSVPAAGPSNTADNKRPASTDITNPPKSQKLSALPSDSSSDDALSDTPLNISGNSGHSQVEGVMDVDNDGNIVSPSPNVGENAPGTTSTGAGSRGNSNMGAALTMPKSISSNMMLWNCSQSRIMTSIGYAHNLVAFAGFDALLTPLQLMPVDFLPFYISPAEFDQVSKFYCTVQKVQCKVTVLGSRVSFDTGTTVSGVANSEHVPIGMYAYGLNTKLPTFNGKLTTSAETPMVPQDWTNFAPSDCVSKLWSSSAFPSFATNTPRHLGYYACFKFNNQNPATTAEQQKHTYGEFRFDQHSSKFLVNGMIGQTICDYQYIPKQAYIGPNQMVCPTGGKEYQDIQVLTTGKNAHGRKYKYINKTSANLSENNGDDLVDIRTKNDNPSYNRNIESLFINRPASGDSLAPIQPQLHVGILATPQIDVSTGKTTYQNTSIYLQVETNIVMELSSYSTFTNGSYVLPKHVMTTGNKGYNEGLNYFGCQMFDKKQVAEKRVTRSETRKQMEGDFEIIEPFSRLI